MHIFNAEKLDGIEDSILSKAAISYASLAQPSEISLSNKIKEIKALASLEDQDLYYVQSILVTSSWNKNDDIFDSKEIWLARNTPSHKPTNLEHNEHDIIGHITANWPMTDDGILIDDNTPVDNLPEKYHIVTGSVIYTGFSDAELRERSKVLIAEIEEGNKYVSMECYFKGFDYGLFNKTSGEYKVLPRVEDTAHLTKYLRAYGGMGEHENYKIGRVLRQITFSGKGFVNKPANPESVIFTKDSMKNFDDSDNNKIIHNEKKTVSEIIGVFSNKANLKEMNMNSQAETETKNCDEAQASVSSLSEKTTQLETALQEAQATIESLTSEKSTVESTLSAQAEEIKSLKSALETANEVLAGYKAKEEEMMKKEKKMKRASALIASGLTTEVAEATVEKFDSLDDTAFEAVTSLLAAKKADMKSSMEEKEEEDMEEKDTKASTKVDSSALENVEVEQEIDLSVGGNASTEVENTRAALVDFVYNRLGKKLNKGE
jgi:hypothetical protein